MERNTVNIDIETYNKLLIKSNEYDKMKKKNEPVVNVVVRNESDLPTIKTYIDETNPNNKDF